jgi:uncharacterized membrane protein
MMEEPLTPSTDTSAKVEILIRPNRSLSASTMLAVVAVVALVAFTIGLGFWLMGAVLILPFAGLEALLVGVVFWLLYRHQADHELIVITDDRVEIIRTRGEKESRERFQRYWVQVRTVAARDGHLPRVLLGSHGRFVEVGSALNGPEREALSQELKQKLRFPGG